MNKTRQTIGVDSRIKVTRRPVEFKEGEEIEVFFDNDPKKQYVWMAVKHDGKNAEAEGDFEWGDIPFEHARFVCETILHHLDRLEGKA